MTSSNRREFLTQAAALIATSGLPVPALAQAKPKLVVVGGGPGGSPIRVRGEGFQRRGSRSRWSSRCGSSSPASTRTSISATSEAGSRCSIPMTHWRRNTA